MILLVCRKVLGEARAGAGGPYVRLLIKENPSSNDDKVVSAVGSSHASERVSLLSSDWLAAIHAAPHDVICDASTRAGTHARPFID